jgi:hypothetical protein
MANSTKFLTAVGLPQRISLFGQFASNKNPFDLNFGDITPKSHSRSERSTRPGRRSVDNPAKPTCSSKGTCSIPLLQISTQANQRRHESVSRQLSWDQRQRLDPHPQVVAKSLLVHGRLCSDAARSRLHWLAKRSQRSCAITVGVRTHECRCYQVRDVQDLMGQVIESAEPLFGRVIGTSAIKGNRPVPSIVRLPINLALRAC